MDGFFRLLCSAALLAWAAPAFSQTSAAPEPGIDPHWIYDPQSQCWAGDPDPHPGESIVWTGACEGGRLAGQGTLTWYRDGRIEGRDTGTFKDGILSGHGTIIRVDGAMFEGDFPGRGIVTLADGTTFEATAVREAGGWSIQQAAPGR